MDATTLTDATGITPEKIVEQLLSAAKVRMAIGEGPPPPTIVAWTGQQMIMVMMEFDSAEGKRQALAAAWQQLQPHNPEFMVMLLDCYAKTDMLGEGAKEAMEQMESGVSLANLKKDGDPNVKEALMFSVYPRGKDSWIKMVPYERNAVGEFVFTEPSDIQKGPGDFMVDNIGPQEWTKEGNSQFKLNSLMRKAGKHKETIH